MAWERGLAFMPFAFGAERLARLRPFGTSPRIFYRGAVKNGPDQVRTDDLLNAIEALFQLSYEPIRLCEDKKTRFFPPEGKEFLTMTDSA